VDRGLLKGLSELRYAEKSSAKNLSDACVLTLGGERFLVVVSDEGHEFALLRLGSDPPGKLVDLATLEHPGVNIELPRADQEVEIDFEAVACSAERVLLVASASLKRKKPKKNASGTKQLENVVPASGAGHEFSDFVYELVPRATPGGLPSFTLVGARNLRDTLLNLPVLSPFRDIPSKDNGLDVEGALIHGQYFYFGLRGPVLRGRAVVARLRADFSQPELFALDLGGLGVRALTYVESAEGGSVYILAGPTMPTKTGFSLYRWTGHEAPTTDDAGASKVTLVAEVPARDDLNPEALFVLDRTLCTVSDGTPGGEPSCRPLP
jgi:hypothetical protein